MSDAADHRLLDRLLTHARHTPSAPAIVTSDGTLDYATLARRVHGCAEALMQMGVTSDSTVALACEAEVPHLIASLALAALGSSQLALPSHEPPSFRDELAQRINATHRLGEEDIKRLSAADTSSLSVTDRPAKGSAGLIYLSTSGTTGAPKLVVLGDNDLVSQAPRHIGSPQERFACIAGIEHNFAKRHRLYCVAQGAANVFLETTGIDTVPAQCDALEVNVLHVSAFQARDLLGARDLEALRNLTLKIGGSHVPLALRNALMDHITPTLYTGYGTTETGAIAFAGPGQHDAEESVGVPLSGIELRIAPTDPGTPTATAEAPGEILIRADGLFRAYLGNPGETARRLVDGWFHTGDLGFLDAHNRLVLRGRRDDMFVFNSMNIYPQELETCIRQHGAVEDVAVVPRHSAVHGAIPVAIVQAKTGAALDPGDLRSFARERLGLRCPRQFVLVDHVPRNRTGKIQRDAAQALIAE